jgi:hypothetical protein
MIGSSLTMKSVWKSMFDYDLYRRVGGGDQKVFW